MAKWKFYGVFISTGAGYPRAYRFAFGTNKKRAVECAKRNKGFVKVMAYAREYTSFDYPTFNALSDMFQDFTESGPKQEATTAHG